MANRSKPATGSNVKIDASAAFGYKSPVMPWVRRSHGSRRFYWILAGIAARHRRRSHGLFLVGDSAPFITIVEQQLGQSQAQVRRLEKRVRALEAKLGIIEYAAEPASTAKAY